MENPFEILEARLERIESMLRNISNGTTKDRPLKVENAAKLLGCSKSKIYHLTSREEIPFYRQGKFLYFFEDELLNWLRDNH